METKKIRRPGSGRTAGSFSFVKISLKELNAKFKDEETPIVVGRKWAEGVGFGNLTTSKVQDIMGKIEGTTPETAVQAKVHNFE